MYAFCESFISFHDSSSIFDRIWKARDCQVAAAAASQWRKAWHDRTVLPTWWPWVQIPLLVVGVVVMPVVVVPSTGKVDMDFICYMYELVWCLTSRKKNECHYQVSLNSCHKVKLTNGSNFICEAAPPNQCWFASANSTWEPENFNTQTHALKKLISTLYQDVCYFYKS